MNNIEEDSEIAKLLSSIIPDHDSLGFGNITRSMCILESNMNGNETRKIKAMLIQKMPDKEKIVLLALLDVSMQIMKKQHAEILKRDAIIQEKLSEHKLKQDLLKIREEINSKDNQVISDIKYELKEKAQKISELTHILERKNDTIQNLKAELKEMKNIMRDMEISASQVNPGIQCNQENSYFDMPKEEYKETGDIDQIIELRNEIAEKDELLVERLDNIGSLSQKLILLKQQFDRVKLDLDKTKRHLSKQMEMHRKLNKKYSELKKDKINKDLEESGLLGDISSSKEGFDNSQLLNISSISSIRGSDNDY
ncbi:unnamed protein product [Moneuplotes crassus]|uniref:Uncharacterized protein n=1 Tax=Euplotes crassus TaxID=5936 RepID=A0AAD1XKD0_EUPCR|nr:unnamed protein product [Moneuplotes crassus]